MYVDLKLRKGGLGRIKLGQYDNTQELAFKSLGEWSTRVV
jgi:hypothetical protein